MRDKVDRVRLERFMREIGRAARSPVRVYLVGGATALLRDWRPMTIDIDLYFEPDSSEIYQAIPRLKDALSVNVELASPAQFVPELPGWETRSEYIATHGGATFYHYDLYSQCLSKIERGHAQDVEDVRCMLSEGSVEPARLRELFEQVKDQLVRYPSIDPDVLAERIDAALEGY